jgi:hypothetical protein
MTYYTFVVPSQALIFFFYKGWHLGRFLQAACPERKSRKGEKEVV